MFSIQQVHKHVTCRKILHWDRFTSLQNGHVWPRALALQNDLPCQLFWYVHPRLVKHVRSCSYKKCFKKTEQNHFVELPPCPELSSNCLFPKPFYRVFTLSLILFGHQQKLLRTTFAHGRSTQFFCQQCAGILVVNVANGIKLLAWPCHIEPPRTVQKARGASRPSLLTGGRGGCSFWAKCGLADWGRSRQSTFLAFFARTNLSQSCCTNALQFLVHLRLYSTVPSFRQEW